MSKRIVTIALLVGLIAAFGFAQAKKTTGNSLVGTWKVAETTAANGEKIANPQPGLYIFTPKYYSAMSVTGTKPRPKYEQGKATDAEKVATFDAFAANSGTYTFSGTVLKTRPI